MRPGRWQSRLGTPTRRAPATDGTGGGDSVPEPKLGSRKPSFSNAPNGIWVQLGALYRVFFGGDAVPLLKSTTETRTGTILSSLLEDLGIAFYPTPNTFSHAFALLLLPLWLVCFCNVLFLGCWLLLVLRWRSLAQLPIGIGAWSVCL